MFIHTNWREDWVHRLGSGCATPPGCSIFFFFWTCWIVMLKLSGWLPKSFFLDMRQLQVLEQQSPQVSWVSKKKKKPSQESRRTRALQPCVVQSDRPDLSDVCWQTTVSLDWVKSDYDLKQFSKILQLTHPSQGHCCTRWLCIICHKLAHTVEDTSVCKISKSIPGRVQTLWKSDLKLKMTTYIHITNYCQYTILSYT